MGPVQFEQLVLHGPVIEVEGAAAEQKALSCEPRFSRSAGVL
jgi:hypothetical protein